MSKKGWMLLAIVLAVGLIVMAGLALTTPRAKFVALPQLPTPPEGVKYADHSEVFRLAGITTYEGAKSCVQCHEEAVDEVLHSYHYLEYNTIDDIAGKENVVYGGRFAYNDFCGSIFWEGEVNINFIGKAVLKVTPEGKEDLKGTFIASGCSMCHGVSMGKLPQPEATEEQLANIDCLQCHSDVYLSGARGVKKGLKAIQGNPDTGFWYTMGESLDMETVAKHIVARPTNDICLGCHAFSGGGPGFKRPNLTPDLMEPEVPENIDVHIARGMQCVDCHVASGHRFGTKVVDTWSRESDEYPTCESCHQVRHTEPVIGWVLDTFHTEAVACQTCHIPSIAKGQYPTDVKRHWDEAEFNEKLVRWEPILDMEKNVEPVYAWWNEQTREAYLYPNPVEPKDGIITLAKPVGQRGEGKIYPFKYHQAIVPYDPVNKLPIPIKVGVVFATGNLDTAYELGAKPGGLQVSGEFVTLERYMGVNHGVEPAENALGCFDCHGFKEERMPWRALGYGIYPPVAFTFFTVVLPLLIVALIVYGVIRRRQKAVQA